MTQVCILCPENFDQQILSDQIKVLSKKYKIVYDFQESIPFKSKTNIKNYFKKTISKIISSDIIISNANKSSSSLAQKTLIAKLFGKKIIIISYVGYGVGKTEISPWLLWISNNTLPILNQNTVKELKRFKESIFEKIFQNISFKQALSKKRRIKKIDSFYISGPYKHVDKKDDYRTKQTEELKKIGFKIIDACSEKHTGDLRQFIMNDKNVIKIVQGDLKALKLCNAMIFNTQKSSSGGGQEALLFKILHGGHILGITYDKSTIWDYWLFDDFTTEFDNSAINKIKKIKQGALFHNIVKQKWFLDNLGK